MKKALLTYFLILAITVCIFPQAQAQNTDIAKKDLVREGNKLYKMAEYAASDSLFAAAAALDSTYSTALYNLGNSSYLGGNPGTAKAAWMKSLLNTADEKGKTDIFYNLAGIEMDGKNYGEAIKLYKDALRRDPTDEQARYNLALAQKLLKDQQQNQTTSKTSRIKITRTTRTIIRITKTIRTIRTKTTTRIRTTIKTTTTTKTIRTIRTIRTKITIKITTIITTIKTRIKTITTTGAIRTTKTIRTDLPEAILRNNSNYRPTPCRCSAP